MNNPDGNRQDGGEGLFSRGLRKVLLGAGLLCCALGLLGIFLPLVPTVPFLLLAAACFARSSERFHAWLLEHPRFGPILSGYLGGRGIPRSSKVAAIATLWATLAPAAVFLVPILWVRVLLFCIGAGVTIYLLQLPTLASDADPRG